MDNVPSQITPIEGQIKELYQNIDIIEKRLGRILDQKSSDEAKIPSSGVLGELQGFNSKLRDIISRLQI